MPYCEFCGESAGTLPFKCSYCGGQFCATHRLPESHDCSLDVEFRKQHIIEKQRNRERHRRRKDIGVPGERYIAGTLVLYLILIVSSIIAYFYPYHMCISYYTLGFYTDSHIWTIFTSIFVLYFSNPFEFAYFIVLLICSYYYIRTIENRYGPKFLLFLFISCSVLGGLFNLFISLFFTYYIFIYFFIPIGLASGGLLGVNLFLLLDNLNKDWFFFRFKLKGKQMIWFLSISNIIVKVVSTILFLETLYFFIPFLITWYIFDLFGLLGAVTFHKGYYKKRY